jgi:glycosyltransferase involved in cell wall biosynthesis
VYLFWRVHFNLEKQNDDDLNLYLKTEVQNPTPTPKKLKVLWWSNAAHTGTGYGVQTSNVVYRLLKRGFDVRVSTNFGLEGAALGFNDLIQYPRTGFSEFGEDCLKLVIDNWKPHVLVTLFDVWIGAFSKYFGEKDWLSQIHNRTIAWLPVDSDPVADVVADQASKVYRAVAMSKFGQTELKRVGVKSELIPHGVESQVFKPAIDKKASKLWLEKHSCPINLAAPAKIAVDDFVVGVNAANKDPSRKDYARMLIAFKLFLDQCPEAKKNAKLYLHTWLSFPGGTDIRGLAHKLGLDLNVKSTFEYDMLCSLTPEALASQYNGFDVLLNLARGEGFGVPILEAESCGVPVVATDFTAMTELVSGHGWLVPPFASEYHGGAKLLNGLNALWAVPDEYKAADALADAYLHPEKVKALGVKCRSFALGYDFDTTILPLWSELLGEVQSELGMFGSAAGKDAAFEALFNRAVKGAT